jgi:hypothetical protein
MNTEKFADGCHRYGWLITIIINALMLAYFVGTSNQSLQDIKERVGRMEQQWDRYLHEVRGVEKQ